MQKKSIKIIILVIFLILLAVFSIIVFEKNRNKNSLSAQDLQETTSEISSPTNSEISFTEKEMVRDYKNEEILQLSKSDLTIGDKNAPVVFIEYASLSCPHCASFYRESFIKIKEKYIDSNKVLFVFRDFPLNEPALLGATYAKCVAKEFGSEKYFETIKSLFKTQDSWAFDGNFIGRLESIASLEGMNGEKFSKCINDKEIQDLILKDRLEAARVLQLKSVPSFFVNGELSAGYVDYVTLERLIEKKLQEKEQSR